VMAFSVISISSDSSKESVGTSTARVILFGTIPAMIPSIAPTTDLPVIHDDTPLIPTDTPTIPTIPHVAPTIQYTSPFIDTDSSDSDILERPPSQDPYEVTVARWRRRVAACSSPPLSPIRQILPAPPSLPCRPAILVLPRQPIPIGRPYRTQPNGVLKMLIARKSVGSLPAHRLASRYLSDSSLSDCSSRHSSSGYAISDSPDDLSTATFAGPSHKKCRSPTSSVPIASPRFQELTLLCTKMVLEEEDKVEKYIGGLSDNIQGNVIAVEPTRLQDAIRVANNLMDQKLKGYAIKNAENKRRFDSNPRDNRGQQQPFKRHNVNGQNVARAYTVGNNVERKGYAGVLPYRNKCRMHHEEPCMAKCDNCKRVGHMTRDCRTAVAATPQRAPVGNQTGNVCYECGRQGHHRNECTKLRNQNRGNKTGNKTRNNEAKARAYAIGGGGAGLDSNVVTGVLCRLPFSTLLDVIPSTLDTSYAEELADGRISKTNVILRGCTLGLLGHPLDIDLIPVELGSFDVIVGMDWLAKYHAVIVCDEKLVRIPYGDKVLIIEGDGCNGGITAKKSDDKSEEKRLKDVPIIRDFPEVFPENLPRLPPTRKDKFKIYLVPGAAPVARSPYRLAPAEMQELSTQLHELSDKEFIRPSSSPRGAPVLFVKKKNGSFQMCIDYH
ncbi:putative reverse transcriptase domain-containing protein, partial [Tanacetum coccineum]